MSKTLIYCLMGDIEDKIPQFKSCGMVGTLDSQGRVFWGDKEKSYIGITDKKGNYFYVRYRSKDVQFREGKRIESCGFNYIKTLQYRMVMVFREYVPESIMNQFMIQLSLIDLKSFAVNANPDIKLTGGGFDFEKIFKDETGLDMDKASGNIRLAYIDFDMDVRLDNRLCCCDDLCEKTEFDAYRELRSECKTLDKLIALLTP